MLIEIRSRFLIKGNLKAKIEGSIDESKISIEDFIKT
jgi:hypothetical protein